jgi:1-deoxy-D-xylulose-5-phosphate reductoisomerase
MNKALEVIEACYLFGMDPGQVDVVIHPQSVIHSMVQYRDASVVAQLGTPDMRGPIAYGLAWPDRIESGAATLDFASLSALTFEAIDTLGHRARFPGLWLSWQALAGPPGTTAVLNAANEIAVESFLARQIRFDQIHAINDQALSRVQPGSVDQLEDLLALDARVRAVARQHVQSLSR